MEVRRVRPSDPVDLRLTFGPLRRRPAMRVSASEVWWATRTPAGAATVHMRGGGHEVEVRAWGDGAEWAVDQAPEALGCRDTTAGFSAHHPLVAALARRLPGLRIARTARVFEALVPAILEQKVQAVAARRSYAALVRRWGAPAPGPGAGLGLRVPPAADTLRAVPSYALHPLDVERRRADTIRLAARHAARLEEAVSMPAGDAAARLQVLPGIGPWTAATVALSALGDADAVLVGDFHVPNIVSFALAGEPRGDDDRMLELLEPYRGHRGRVIRLLLAAGIRAPAYGPRLPLRSIASL